MKIGHKLIIGVIGLTLSTLSSAATLTSQPYGTTKNGQKVDLYTMTNKHGVSVSFISYGGVITQILTPDAKGKKDNIVLGFDNLHGYEVTDTEAGFHFGALIGRYANRIGGGKFTLDGKTYQLEKNNGPNTLHSAGLGYDKRVWQVTPLSQQGETVKASLKLTSPDGDQGFPGQLQVEVIYSLSDNNEFQIEYKATTDQPTVVSLTNHSYFNLAGAKNSPYGVLDHILQVNANQILTTDANSLPTGEIASVKDTPFDFNQPKAISRDIRHNNTQLGYGFGYDQTWVLNPSKNKLNLAAKVIDPKSKRTLEVSTTEPSIQVYTANHLPGNIAGSEGVLYRQADAIALETQQYPDSPNQPKFPSTRLNPGDTYHSVTVFKFGVNP